MHPAQVLDLQEDLYSRCMQDDVERLLASHYALDAKALATYTRRCACDPCSSDERWAC